MAASASFVVEPGIVVSFRLSILSHSKRCAPHKCRPGPAGRRRAAGSSTWSVADASTAELMIRFYGHLLADVPKRAAQPELIRGPVRVPDGAGGTVERDYSSPYCWVAFQLIGDWR